MADIAIIGRPKVSNPILKQAVVVGAGMGGLAAAKAVAAHFEKVIVFDRDALPDEPAPRAGTPQSRHTHNLLAGGSLLKPQSALREPELVSRVMAMMAPA